ncbi:MAG: sialate O-acetylesterase [Ruminococcaceae bacterium]|nr:sialate O-acetylesterase [Oscillospiraceae bacterium]
MYEKRDNMKKTVSLLLVFALLISSMAIMNVSAAIAYVDHFRDDFTVWTLTKGSNNASHTYTKPSNTNTTMTITSSGSLTANPSGYPRPTTRADLVKVTDLATSYPDVAAGTGLTTNIVKFTQNAKIGMFRMKSATGTDVFSNGDTMRVSFRIYLTDICTKGINYETGTTTIVNPVPDTNNTIKNLKVCITPQATTTIAGTKKSIEVPVNQWVTIEEDLAASQGADGFRIDFDGYTGGAAAYTTAYAGTIFYDGNISIQKLTTIAEEGPKDGDYTMLSRVELGGATAVTSSSGTLTAKYSDQSVTYAASNGGKTETSHREDPDTKELYKVAEQYVTNNLTPSDLESSYPGISQGTFSTSGKISRLTRTAPASMLRIKDLVKEGTYEPGDRFRMKAYVYVADVYSKAATETPEANAIKDTAATEAKLRFVFCQGTLSNNSDNIHKEYTIPLNEWTEIVLEGVVNTDTLANGLRIDQSAGSTFDVCYGQSYAGTVFFGDISFWKAAPVIERNTNTNWTTVSNVDFESDKAAVSGSEYIVSDTSSGSITNLNTLVSTYPDAESAAHGEKIFNFSMNNSKSSQFKIENIFDNSDLVPGDIVRISAMVFPADLTTTSATVRMYYPDAASQPVTTESSTSLVYLSPNKWTKLAFTFMYDQTHASLTPSVIIDSNGSSEFANTLLISDIKTEVLKTASYMAESLLYTEDFEGYNQVTQSYVNQPKYRAFGLGTYALSMYTNNKNLTGAKAYSHNRAYAITTRINGNMGIKVNDIFEQAPKYQDIGKIFKISVMVYPDSNKLYSNNSTKKADAIELTADEYESAESTSFTLSLGGPDDAKYKYRSCNFQPTTTKLPFDTWSKMELTYTVTEDFLDNGLTDTMTNPLISAIRIDQSTAQGGSADAICDTFYIDDVTVREVPEPTISVANCFQSNMILQRNKPINVWGFAKNDGKEISVTFGNNTQNTKSKDGKWQVTFPAMDASTNLTMKVSAENEGEIVFTNVAVGEVILAAGQSNMQFTMRNAKNVETIIADVNTMSKIHMLTSSVVGSFDEQAELTDASWFIPTTSTVKNVTAVGYITAYNIAKEENIPVGIISASLGGSKIQAFMSTEVLKSRSEYSHLVAEQASTKAQGTPSEWKAYPSGLYNTLLYPLKGLSIGSALWYQGESNTGHHDLYQYQLYDLVNMLRSTFNNDNMPVCVCELAPYFGDYSDMRLSQYLTARRMENVHLISTSDTGPLNDDFSIQGVIHPSNKLPVGERCALALRKSIFNYSGEYTGPMYEYMKVQGDKAFLYFSHADGLKMISKNGETTLTGFEISSDGQTFVKADATIDGNTVIVSSDSVTKPVEVRYCDTTYTYIDADGNLKDGKGIGESAFKDTYIPAGCTLSGYLGGNLYNGANLPCSPFVATVIKPTVTSYSKETKDNKINYTVELKNTGFSSGNPQVIAAVYTDGQLKYMKSFDTNFATQDIRKITDSFDASIVNQDSELKFFLWDGFNRLKPFESSKILTFK